MKNYKKISLKLTFVLALCLNIVLIDKSFAKTPSQKTTEQEASLMDPIGGGEDYLKVADQNVDRFNIICKKSITMKSTYYNFFRDDSVLFKLTRFFITEHAGIKYDTVNHYTHQFTVTKIGENPVRVLDDLESTVSRFYSTVNAIVLLPIDRDAKTFENSSVGAISPSVCYKADQNGEFKQITP